MNRTSNLFSIACISAIASFVAADQPVHCVKSQLAGYWTLEVAKESIQPILGSVETVCTHELPNKLQIIEEGTKFHLPGQVFDLYLLLDADFTAHVLDGPEGSPTGEGGRWTTVYDQSMVIELSGSHHGKYHVNPRYNLKPEIEEDQFDQLTTGSYEAFDSKCDETMVGVKLNDGYVQCWVGYQDSPLTTQKVHENKNESSFILAQTSSEAKPVSGAHELAQTETKGRLGRFDQLPENERVLLAQVINEANLTWTADSYSASSSDSAQTSLAQTSAKARSKTFARSAGFGEAWAEAKRFLNRPIEDIDINEMPTEWDWENVLGFDFTGDVADQGHCGSCYLLASNGMIESRLKIMEGKDIPLAVQPRLECNFMNEGCHGGWGFFDGLFLENYGAVGASCASYVQGLTDGGCAQYEHCEPVAKVSDTYYVGSRAYGQLSEADMIKELRTRGPILLDFNAGAPFQAYKNGIMSEEGAIAQTFAQTYAQIYSSSYCDAHGGSAACMSDSTSELTQEDLGLQWSKLTHSTLLIGYGEELTESHGLVKYWKVRNSYGDKWGENGNFRIRRGRNEFNCESENIAVVPYLV